MPKSVQLHQERHVASHAIWLLDMVRHGLEHLLLR